METKETSQLAGKAYEDSDNTVVHQLKRIETHLGGGVLSPFVFVFPLITIARQSQL